jgi:hypothetical protein
VVFTNRFLILMTLFIFTAFTQSCGPRLSSEAQSYIATSQEVPECLTDFPYSNSINVSTRAVFFKRSTEPVIDTNTNKITNMILSDPIVDPLPIPYAEVAVYNSNKQLVQCGMTDFDGNLIGLSGGALEIPDTPNKSYLIRVYARANVQMPNKGFIANASVKEDPYTNRVYYIETTFETDGVNTTPINLVAYARQTDDISIKGGAFNIYNNFIQAYTYLDENLTVPNSELVCLSKKFSMYWKAGFNPFQYEYPTADPNTLSNSSYYKSENDSFYISGGQVGDISLSNTDHFDDFASIHEMGHFIEDQCGRLDSPGGSHAIIVRIDPRLAWHEGWANYFAGVVTNARQVFINPELTTKLASGTTDNKSWSFLFNSYGFSDSVQNVGNGSGFMMDLKRPGTSPGEWQFGPYNGVTFDIVNPSQYPGEGHFREGAISRALFKMTVPPATLCTSCGSSVYASSPVVFNSMWQAFDANGGMGDAGNLFSSSNQFLEKLKILLTSPTWNSSVRGVADSESLHLFSDQNLGSSTLRYVTSVSGTPHLNWIPPGHKLLQTACSKPTIIQPRSDEPNLTGINSDQRYSNHFYMLDTSLLSGLNSITVTFQKLNGTNTDHDLIIYEENYRFNGDYSCDVAEASDGTCPTNNYIPSRGTNASVIASNRATASTLSSSYSKTISNLAIKLVPGKKYLFNVRAYTANRSLSIVTAYKYTMTSNLGTLCPE